MYGQVGFRMTFPLLMPTVDAQKRPPKGVGASLSELGWRAEDGFWGRLGSGSNFGIQTFWKLFEGVILKCSVCVCVCGFSHDLHVCIYIYILYLIFYVYMIIYVHDSS